MANLLLHICCGPCATYTIEHWRGEGLEARGLWFNPNIHPSLEHQLRREAMESLAGVLELPLLTVPSPVTEYFAAVSGDRANRCAHCFYLRLSRTAALAREQGWDAFSTTLLVSPYQKHSLLREVAEKVSGEQGVRFLYADLRPGYPESRRRARRLKLYRQSYCGCIYSLLERQSGRVVPGGEGLRASSR